MMDQRIPKPVQPILEKYTSLVEKHLPGFICGFYIVGSIALNGFNERFSDVDFVAVLDHPASQADIESLRAIHTAIEKDFPKWELSGSYFQRNDLGCLERAIPLHPYYHDGKLRNENSGVNSVTWWELKNHGIDIWGEKPEKLPFTVDWELLITGMRENLNSYWAAWTKRGKMIVMLSDWGIQWTVLGVLRQYYTFRENSITTKLGAGKYALTCFPIRWHPLIQEAIDIREGGKQSHYRSAILRMVDTVNFMKYVIEIG